MKSGVPNLRALRKDFGFTQQSLSEKSGIPQATISGLESGEQQRVDFDTLLRLARAMSLDVSRLFDQPKDDIEAPAKRARPAAKKTATKRKRGR